MINELADGYLSRQNDNWLQTFDFQEAELGKRLHSLKRFFEDCSPPPCSPSAVFARKCRSHLSYLRSYRTKTAELGVTFSFKFSIGKDGLNFRKRVSIMVAMERRVLSFKRFRTRTIGIYPRTSIFVWKVCKLSTAVLEFRRGSGCGDRAKIF